MLSPVARPDPGWELREGLDGLSLRKKLLCSRSSLARGWEQGQRGARRPLTQLPGASRRGGLRGCSRVLPLVLRNQRNISKKIPTPKATC